MGHLFQALAFTILGSVTSLVGGLFLLWRENAIRRYYLLLVGFAAGVLIGAAFFDLLPEAIDELGSDAALTNVAVGLLLFFFVEKFLLWYHSHTGHEEHSETKAAPELIFFGDAIHNFLDGAIIATAFAESFPVGLIATLAVFLHEIPQEIGDFSVMLYSGLSQRRTLLLNVYSSLFALAGALLAYFYTSAIDSVPELLSLAAGGFIYIAVAELMPELVHKSTLRFRSILLGLSVVIGLLLIRLLTFYFIE